MCRNGEPHLPTREACQAEFRDMEQMARDYSENLAASNNCSERMRKNAAKHNSVKGPQIIPLRSVWHIVPSGLHITLFMAPAGLVLMEGWCDVLEEEVDETVLAQIADILEVEEEPSGEEVEDEEVEVDPAETATTSNERPRVKRGYSASRLELEKEAQEAMLEVTQADLYVQQVNKEVLKRMNILRRIQVNLEADILKREGKMVEATSKWQEVELIARSENTNKRSLTSFHFCTKLCLLTFQDHQIKWQICSLCGLSCHRLCELWDALEAATPPAPVPEDEVESGSEAGHSSGEEEVAAARVPEDPCTCRDCRAGGFKDFQEMKNVVLPWLEAGKAKLIAAQVELERARAKQQLVAEKLKHLLGDRRKELARILEEDLHVVKTAYQGGTYVGNHCHRILLHHEQLSVVLASTSRPELQANFNLFCATYLRIHHLMKAARWLTEDEVSINSTKYLWHCLLDGRGG